MQLPAGECCDYNLVLNVHPGSGVPLRRTIAWLISVWCDAEVKFGGGKSKTASAGPETVPAPSTNSHSNPRAPSVTAPKANSNSGRPPAAQPSPQSAPQPQQQPARAPLARDKPPLPVLTNENCPAYYAEPLPAFRDVPPSEKQLLLVKKLHLCSFTFDFTDQVPRRAGLIQTFCHLAIGISSFVCWPGHCCCWLLRQKNVLRVQ